MFYAVSVRLDSSRDARNPSFRREIDATLKARRNLAYRKFKTLRAAEIELANLPERVRAECKVEALEMWGY